MKAKWCFSVLIAILILLGVNQHQTSTPNQEIVVQFDYRQVTSDEAQNAIGNVKAHLQLIGAVNIQVREGTNGVLKITYYSDSDVASIKEVLLKDHALKLGLTSHYQSEESENFPSDKEPNNYNFDVYEIHPDSDTDWDLEGISIVEFKSENHRFFNPNAFASIKDVDDKERIVKIAIKVNTDIAIAIDNTSYKVPEVRAGPFSVGNS